MYRQQLRMNAIRNIFLLRNMNQMYNKEPPPKVPQNKLVVKQAGIGGIVFILTPLMAMGAVAYASYDKRFRKTLEDNIPGAELIMKLTNSEISFAEVFTDTTKITVMEYVENVIQYLKNSGEFVVGFFGSAKEKEKTTFPSPAKTLVAQKEVDIVDKKSGRDVREESTYKVGGKSVTTVPLDILELEQATEMSVTLAIKEYNNAIDVLRSFHKDVELVVDQAVENIDPSQWTKLRNRVRVRDTAVEVAMKMGEDAMNKINKCERALRLSNLNDSNKEQVEIIQTKIKKFADHLKNAKQRLLENQSISETAERYWKNVENSRNYFIDEIESIFPGLNLASKKIDIPKEDLDILILHAYSHVLAYQKELKRLQTEGEMRLKRAIEKLRGEEGTDAFKVQMGYQLENEKRKIEIDNQKKIFKIRADHERQLRQQLKYQAEAHVDHLADVIAMKESELHRKYNRDLEEKITEEKTKYKLQLATMLGKVRGMDVALEARANVERSAHQAQALWTACQALWSSIRTGEPGAHWKSKLRPLENEIQAVTKVAGGDEMVDVILKNLPREARERGVFPEDALRERFLNVERLARRLALVPDGAVTLPVYFLSYIQSLFILKPDDPISNEELKNAEFDHSKLDTYDILNRAKYYVDRGDLMQALKYMNLLQGASRRVASDWLKETRIFLETQQAANTLMAHAAANGLLYL